MTDRDPSPSPVGTALVTGASSGLGASYARQLAARGHDLVVVARRSERLEALKAEVEDRYGHRVEPLVADLSRPAGLALVAKRAEASDVRILVNNAGMHGYGPFADQDQALLEEVIALNVVAPTVLSRAVLPHLVAAGAGTIVNVASVLAFSGSIPPDRPPGRATYGASKAYVLAHSRLLAGELAGTGVLVQAVCPGLVNSEFHDDMAHPPAGGAEPDDVVASALSALDAGELVWTAGGTASEVLGPYEAGERSLFEAMVRRL